MSLFALRPVPTLARCSSVPQTCATGPFTGWQVGPMESSEQAQRKREARLSPLFLFLLSSDVLAMALSSHNSRSFPTSLPSTVPAHTEQTLKSPSLCLLSGFLQPQNFLLSRSLCSLALGWLFGPPIMHVI